MPDGRHSAEMALAARASVALGSRSGGATLLHGPAGVGKTRLALALGGRLGNARVVWLHVERVLCAARPEAALHAELAAARAAAPCVLVVDELQSLAPADARPGSPEARLALQLGDGVQDLRSAAVYALGICREPEAVHAALRRAGRIHTQIALRAPPPDERAAMLEALAEGLLPPTSGDDEGAATRMRAVVRAVGMDGHGLCGAHLEALCQHAATAAWRRSHGESSDAASPRSLDGPPAARATRSAAIQVKTSHDAVVPLEAEWWAALLATRTSALSALRLPTAPPSSHDAHHPRSHAAPPAPDGSSRMLVLPRAVVQGGRF